MESRLARFLIKAGTGVTLVFLYAPLQLADNQITISPVEWTN